MKTQNLYLEYEASQERDNTIYSFGYKGKTIRLYKEVDPDTHKDVWFLDFDDFTEATNLNNMVRIYLWKKIPMMYKTLVLYGAHGTDYDQREAVDLKSWEYIFSQSTEGLPELDAIKTHMETLGIVPDVEEPVKEEPVKEGATKMQDNFDKLFDADALEELEKMHKALGIDQVMFPSLLKQLKKLAASYEECVGMDSKEKKEKKPEREYQDSYAIPFTKKELHALYLYIVQGISPFLADPKMMEHMSQATSKICAQYTQARGVK